MRFISKLDNLSINIQFNGAPKEIHFVKTNASLKGGVYHARSKELIDALLADPQYGVWYTTDEEIPVHEKPVQEHKYNQTYESVTRTQEANKILVNEYHIAKESLKSKDDALREAEKLNICFPNLK